MSLAGENAWSCEDEPLTLRPTFAANYAAAVERWSAQPCVTFYDRHGIAQALTFAQFDEWVERAAQVLATEPDPTRVVVLVGGNRLTQLAFITAAWLGGRTVCPVNPEEGLARVREKVRALGGEAVIWYDPNHAEYAALNSAHAMELGAGRPPAGWRRARAPGQPMALIFTSGSTGYAKIVEQREVSVMSNVDAAIAHFALAPGRAVVTPLPVFHVNALEFAFLGCLLSGAHLRLLESFAVATIWSVLDEAPAEEKILSLVPPMLRRMVDAPSGSCTSLLYIFTAAAALPREVLERALAKFGRRVIQGYGLSEAINFSCLLPTDLSDRDYAHWMFDFAVPSIGAAVRGNRVSVLTESGAPAAPGELGELCVRGHNVMHGYRGEAPGDLFAHGAFHTGDLGVYQLDAKGTAFFFVQGRKKETAKRYGLTVSLSEIDDVLASFAWPGFDAIAVAFPNEWSGEELAVVAQKSADWDAALEAALAAHLEARLPGHLRPRLVLITNEALRTASGKPRRWPLRPRLARFRAVNIGGGVRFFADDPRAVET